MGMRVANVICPKCGNGNYTFYIDDADHLPYDVMCTNCGHCFLLPEPVCENPDPVEEDPAQWYVNGSFTTCSACGTTYNTWALWSVVPDNPEGEMPNYCPYCGTKMNIVPN